MREGVRFILQSTSSLLCCAGHTIVPLYEVRVSITGPRDQEQPVTHTRGAMYGMRAHVHK